MLRNLVDNLDTIWKQSEFLGELYMSLGHQLPISLMQSALVQNCTSISDDFVGVSSPKSTILPSLPDHINEKIQTFQGHFSQNYPKISVVNRYHSTSISLRSHERRTFKRNLYDSDIKYCDTNCRNSIDVNIIGRYLCAFHSIWFNLFEFLIQRHSHLKLIYCTHSQCNELRFLRL